MTNLSDTKLLQATFEEVGNIKEEITEIREKIDDNQLEAEQSREIVNEKLDKILEVVSEKFASHHKKIKRIEDHLGLQTLM